MCGINGFVRTMPCDKASVNEFLTSMNNEIIHRGPDDSGEFIHFSTDYCVAMAMRRLSIIDLHTGKQPIYSKDKRITIVFNGEIYNYIELRNELIQNGAEFSTQSDTEVVLKLYEQNGVSAFGLLDGMFAFSIYDSTLDKVFIARDYFGEKPLYYFQENNHFTWASELKSIIKTTSHKFEINRTGLALYFQLTYIPAPYTIYDGIYKLEPNNYIELDCQKNIYSIHEIKREKNDFQISGKETAIALTESLVRESVQSRSIADVPLGTFLSGGVDSSIVSLCLSQQSTDRVNTFSIGFDKESFDESEKANTVAKLINSRHHAFVIGENDLVELIDPILYNFDEPYADSSALATFIVSQKTRTHLKVALTGDGGDEVFGGYNKYFMGSLNKKYTQLISPKIHHYISKKVEKFAVNHDDNRGLFFKVNRFLQSVDYNNDFFYRIISLGFQSNELPLLLKSSYEENSFLYYKSFTKQKSDSLRDLREIDKILSLEGDLLVKVDRTSMLTSLECRAPFLNKKLWDFAEQLPDSYLINKFDKKHILKKAFAPYFPPEFLNKSKKGFGVPVGDWLRSSLRSQLEAFSDISFLEKQAIFHVDAIREMIKHHLSGKKDNSFRIWTFFCFQKWYQNTYDA